MKKEEHQIFSFATFRNKAGDKKQLLISKDGVEVITDESKIQ